MVYEIIWLDEARTSLDAEMEYVYAEFGQHTLADFVCLEQSTRPE